MHFEVDNTNDTSASRRNCFNAIYNCLIGHGLISIVPITMTITHDFYFICKEVGYNFYYIFFQNDLTNKIMMTISETVDQTKEWNKQPFNIWSDNKNKRLIFGINLNKGIFYINLNERNYLLTCVSNEDYRRTTEHLAFGVLNKYHYSINGGAFVMGREVKYEDLSSTNIPSMPSDYAIAIRDNLEESVNPNNEYYGLWATNLPGESMHKAVCSIAVEDNNLPTYFPLFLNNQLDRSRTTNSFNCISLIMPIVFYIQQEPVELDEYYAYGYTDVINFVDMYNMSSGRIINSNYPYFTQQYQCFSIYQRRSNEIRKGFVGLAFRYLD